MANIMYGGTQAEMASLINDSGVLGDAIVTAANVSEVPLDKIFEAIHAIQTEMDVTGTTAEEAATTISGSWSSVQAAWKNLLSGLADEKEMDRLVDNLFETGENLATNILRVVPRIGRNVLEAADSFLSRWDLWGDIKESFDEGGILGALGTIGSAVWGKLQEWGPIGLDAGSALIANIASGVTGNDVSKESIKTSISTLWTGVSEAASIVWDTAGEMYGKIQTALNEDSAIGTEIGKTIAGVFAAGGAGIEGLITASGSLLSNIYKAITGDTEGAQKLQALLSGEGEGAGKAATTAGEIVGGMADAAGVIVDAAKEALEGAKVDGGSNVPSEATPSPADRLGDWVAENMTPEMQRTIMGASGGINLVRGLLGGLSKANWATAALSGITWAITPPEVEYHKPPEEEPIIRTTYEQEGWEQVSKTGEQGQQISFWRPPAQEPTYTQGEIEAPLNAIKNQEPDYEGTSFPGPGGEQIDPWYLYEGLGDLETYWSDGAEEVGNAIIEAAEQVQEETRKQEAEEQEAGRPALDEGEETSALGEIIAGLQGVITALASLPADVSAAAAEGCAAGVGNISVTGHVSTGNVMLSSGLLVGALAPSLNLALGMARNGRG